MNFLSSVVASLLLFFPSSNAVYSLPEPTTANLDVASLDQGWTPKPTERPRIPPGWHELRVRDAGNSSQSLYGYNAPDSVCGYISGRLGASVACNESSTCLAVTRNIPGGGGLRLCCKDLQSCQYHSECVNAEQYTQTSICDDLCRSDVFILKCTDSAKPWCGGYSMSLFNASGYSCDSVKHTGYEVVETTWSGEPGSLITSWYPLTYGQKTLGGAAATTTNATAAPSVSAASNNDSSNNTGAIAGGVVGGVVFIAAAAGIGLFLWLRKRKQRRAAADATGPDGTKAASDSSQDPSTLEYANTKAPEYSTLPPGSAVRAELDTPVMPEHQRLMEMEGDSARLAQAELESPALSDKKSGYSGIDTRVQEVRETDSTPIYEMPAYSTREGGDEKKDSEKSKPPT